MLTQMLVQIPLIFIAAAFWSEYLSWPTGTRWKQWNAQGAPGLLFSAMVMVYWMTPIALDHAATDSLWETAKVASLAAAGISAGISWRMSSGVAHAFYVGNMVWMSITAGMLYQEATQRLCNAYLWDDQAITGQALVVASIILAVTWMLILSRKLGVTVQDAGESGGDLARLQRLGEQLADTRDERLPSQGRAAITAHQHDR
jgi:hypothetical protein